MTTDLVERAETLPAVDAAPQPRSMLAIIAQAASDPGVNVEKMRALFELQRELMADEARAEFNAAFARLSAQLPRVPKNGIVRLIDKEGRDKGSYPFAKWEDIDRVIRPLLSEVGFGLSFNSKPRGADGGGLIVSGTLMHRAGHSITAEMPLPLDTGAGRNNLQATGSTLSYGKRYVAEMLLNIVREGEDTDGTVDEYIDDDKIRQINDLLRETKADVPRFLRHMKVERVPDITVAKFPEAITLLERKKEQMAGANT